MTYTGHNVAAESRFHPHSPSYKTARTSQNGETAPTSSAPNSRAVCLFYFPMTSPLSPSFTYSSTPQSVSSKSTQTADCLVRELA